MRGSGWCLMRMETLSTAVTQLSVRKSASKMPSSITSPLETESISGQKETGMYVCVSLFIRAYEKRLDKIH